MATTEVEQQPEGGDGLSKVGITLGENGISSDGKSTIGMSTATTTTSSGNNGMIPSPGESYGSGLIRAPAAMPLAETQHLNVQHIKQVPNSRFSGQYGEINGPRSPGEQPNYSPYPHGYPAHNYPRHAIPTTPTLNQLLQTPNPGPGNMPWRPSPTSLPHYLNQTPGMTQNHLRPPEPRLPSSAPYGAPYPPTSFPNAVSSLRGPGYHPGQIMKQGFPSAPKSRKSFSSWARSKGEIICVRVTGDNQTIKFPRKQGYNFMAGRFELFYKLEKYTANCR
ncbi:unnamed protein product [Notodromas monacha]|uniref:Uncharacterized protein n=1 Tax=Notodromas monacha TaxID=399045 RepID=A0A7R9GDK1_9CRUS|nr:unnamed protein product [Notodromas monacha]CAG0918758.1 unnamed protein product [Notodromas monacha]